MTSVIRSSLIASIALLTAISTLADDRRNERRTAYVGIFLPVPTGASVDPVRCPDATHPILLSFSGTAQTTEGAATFVQSHCANPEGTSFTRGLQDTTLASGWKMTGTYAGRILPTPSTPTDGVVILDGRYRNTGGTGPYVRATGSGVAAGAINTRTGASSVTVSGTL
jgi:hypothetical protein